MDKNVEKLKKQKLLEKYFGWDSVSYSKYTNTKEYREILKLSYDTIYSRIAFLRAYMPEGSKLMLKDIDFILQREKGSGNQFKKSELKNIAANMVLEHINNLTESELKEFDLKEQKVLLKIKEQRKVNNSELDNALKILYSPLINVDEKRSFELPKETKALTLEEVAKLFDELVITIGACKGKTHPHKAGEWIESKNGLKEKFLAGVKTILDRGDIKITNVRKSKSNVIYACFEPLVKDVDILRYTIFEPIAQAGHGTYFISNVMLEELEKSASKSSELPRLDMMKMKGFSKNHKHDDGKYNVNWFNDILGTFFEVVENNKSDFCFNRLAALIGAEISLDDIQSNKFLNRMEEVRLNGASKDIKRELGGFSFDTILKAIQWSKITEEDIRKNPELKIFMAETLIKEFSAQRYAIEEAKRIDSMIKDMKQSRKGGSLEH